MVVALVVYIVRCYRDERVRAADSGHTAAFDRQQALEADVARLSSDRARLSDPAEVEAQARSRLGMVQPGETPYVVQFPAPPAPVVEDGQAEPGVPWFHTLWNDVTGDPRR